jgi:preprotein translocase SecE subunit
MADKPATTKKRKVKNPETFRERALKANVEDDTPRKRSKISRPFKALLRPIKRLLVAIVTFPLFKPLRTPLRIIGKIIFPVYFRNSWAELKDVTWPSFRESLRLTWAVLLFAIIFGTSVALVDYGLDAVFKRILLK